MGEPYLLGLTPELMSLVTSHLPPDSIRSLATTCRGFHTYLAPSLQKHVDYHRHYRVQHDRGALSTQELVRTALSHPEKAWHVRSYEAWAYRSGLREVELGFWDKNPNWPASRAKDFFTDDELAQIRDIMIHVLRTPKATAEESIQDIREGSDQALKLCLFAMLPRLNRITFFDGPSDVLDAMARPLQFIAEAIEDILKDSSISWPPGFHALRMVTVGPASCHAASGSSGATFTALDIAPLFKLPNIRCLNLDSIEEDYDVHGTTVDLDTIKRSFPCRSSTVEWLCIGRVYSIDFVAILLRAPKQLRHFSYSALEYGDGPDENRDAHDVRIRDLLVDEHRDSLACFHCSRHDHDMLVENHLQAFGDRLPDCRIFEHLGLKIDPVSEPSDYSRVRFRPTNQVSLDSGPAVQKFALPDLRMALPTTLASLRIELDGWLYQADQVILVAVCHDLLWALVDLVRDKRFSQLKYVCLHEVLFPTYADQDLRPLPLTPDNIEAIAQIKAHGVRTHPFLSDNRLLTLHKPPEYGCGPCNMPWSHATFPEMFSSETVEIVTSTLGYREGNGRFDIFRA